METWEVQRVRIFGSGNPPSDNCFWRESPRASSIRVSEGWSIHRQEERESSSSSRDLKFGSSDAVSDNGESDEMRYWGRGRKNAKKGKKIMRSERSNYARASGSIRRDVNNEPPLKWWPPRGTRWQWRSDPTPSDFSATASSSRPETINLLLTAAGKGSPAEPIASLRSLPGKRGTLLDRWPSSADLTFVSGAKRPSRKQFQSRMGTADEDSKRKITFPFKIRYGHRFPVAVLSNLSDVPDASSMTGCHL